MSCVESRMIMRAVVQRNEATNIQEDDPNWQINLLSQPCFAYFKTHTHVADDAKVTAIENIKAIFPADTDILCGDRIVSIENKRGVTLIDEWNGFLNVEAVSPILGRGAAVSHLQVSLQRARE